MLGTLIEFVHDMLQTFGFLSDTIIYNISSVSCQYYPTFHIAKSKKHKAPPLTEDEILQGCKLGLDSHADVHCIGRHARIVDIFEGRVCNVQPFNDSYEPMKGIKTTNAAFAYDTEQGETYILEVNQALDFSDSMEHSLLCPNQSRYHGVVIDDIPPFLDFHQRSTHSVYFPTEDIRLPLALNGPISYLPVRYPTDEEMDTCVHLQLSAGDSIWDPIHLDKQVNAISADDSDELEDSILRDMCDNVIVNALGIKSSEKHISPQSLSELWEIGLHAAHDTIQATTQDHLKQKKGRISR